MGMSIIRKVLVIIAITSISGCVQVQERHSTSVNGQQVYVQESTTQVSFIPGVGL